MMQLCFFAPFCSVSRLKLFLVQNLNNSDPKCTTQHSILCQRRRKKNAIFIFRLMPVGINFKATWAKENRHVCIQSHDRRSGGNLPIKHWFGLSTYSHGQCHFLSLNDSLITHGYLRGMGAWELFLGFTASQKKTENSQKTKVIGVKRRGRDSSCFTCL